MELIIRGTAIYFFIWLITRAMGKRELAEMTAFELILLITIGDLVQQGVTQEDMSITGAMIAVGTIGFWIMVFSYVSWRWRKTERVLAGLPVVVVRDGEPLDQALVIERVPYDELLEAARNQGIDDLAKVRIGILEPDGKFSFLRYDDERHETPDRRAK